MSKKYKFTGESKVERRQILYRIQSLIDFNDVKKGDLGGWISREMNLSHKGNCWVYDESIVSGYARVFGNAKIKDHSEILHKACVYGNAEISGNTMIHDYAKVFGNAKVSEISKVYENSMVYGNAKIYNQTEVCGDAKVFDNAEVYEYAIVGENAKVCGDAKVHDYQIINYGTVTKDILKEKDWELALKCLFKDLEINDNKVILYEKFYKTRNENIFISTYNNPNIIFEKNKVMIDKNITIFCKPDDIEGEFYASYEIDLNDIKLINGYQVDCNKIKILDIIELKHCWVKYAALNFRKQLNAFL